MEVDHQRNGGAAVVPGGDVEQVVPLQPSELEIPYVVARRNGGGGQGRQKCEKEEGEATTKGHGPERTRPAASFTSVFDQNPSIFARYWIITSSAPPPIEIRRVSTNARPAALSFM